MMKMSATANETIASMPDGWERNVSGWFIRQLKHQQQQQRRAPDVFVEITEAVYTHGGLLDLRTQGAHSSPQQHTITELPTYLCL